MGTASRAQRAPVDLAREGSAMHTDDLPPHLRARFDAIDPAWTAALPARLAALADAWQLRLGAPAGPLSYHLVLAAEGSDGAAFVLKVGPNVAELARERAALAHWDGDGTPKLVASAPDALLVERVTPGTSLRHTADEHAIPCCCRVLEQLWRKPAPVGVGLELRAWAGAVIAPSKTVRNLLSPRLLQRAASVLACPNGVADGPLLHGDLHHDNLLVAGDGEVVAIDPKGIRGPRAYDVASFLLNPVGSTPRELLGALPARLRTFADLLSLEVRPLAAVAGAHAVLSAAWTADASGGRDAAATAIARRAFELADSAASAR